jgi:hypothetical protein
MKLIYTSEDRFMVWGVKNSLEMSGFKCHIRNEFASGGAGDIAPIDTWPEVWLENDADYDTAYEFLHRHILNQYELGNDWICSNCGEKNGGAFEFCWNCGQSMDGKTFVS